MTDEAGGHCVHELARQGNNLDAQVEKFFDDVLIDDIKQTPVPRPTSSCCSSTAWHLV